MAMLNHRSVLQITGLFTDAENPAVGAERAVAVLDILASQLEAHRYSLRSREAEEEVLITNDGKFLVACEIEILPQRDQMDSIAFRESHADF